MIIRHVPPPPTTFPCARGAQSKTGPARIAPPPTRYGAASPIQPKAVPSSTRPVLVPPSSFARQPPLAVPGVIQPMKVTKKRFKKTALTTAKKKLKTKKKEEISSEEEEEPNPFVAVQYGGGQSETHHIIPRTWTESTEGAKINKMYQGSEQISHPRSYAPERPKQLLRWLATLVFAKYSEGVEIQCYYDTDSKTLYVSSNKNSVNKKIREHYGKEWVKKLGEEKGSTDRQIRHGKKLLVRDKRDGQGVVWTALENGNVVVPDTDHKVDYHAERRIQEKVGKALDPEYLGGVKRPCLVCARALNLVNARRGPAWNSAPGLFGYTLGEVLEHALENQTITYVTLMRSLKKPGKKVTLTTDYDSESDSDADD